MPKKPAKKDEDTSMALSDDGEADDDDIPAPKKKVKEEDESVRKSKKEREEELRRMMEEDEDDDDEPEEENDPADQEMEEAPEPEPEPEPKEEAKEEPSEVVSSTEGGRRRGRRKVMQKKRILDDQGYMGKFIHFIMSTKCNYLLTPCSDNSGTWLGVLLRGRSARSSEEGSASRFEGVNCRQTQETCRQTWSRQHHVFLLQEVMKSVLAHAYLYNDYLLAFTKSCPCV